MKKIVQLFLTICLFIFISCVNEESAINDVILKYQNSLNENNTVLVKDCFENPNLYQLELSLSYIKSFYELGIIPKYRIDVLEYKINGSIAEIKLKTSVNFSSDDTELLEGLSYLIPPVTNSVMTLRKIDNIWKIVSEEIIE